MRGCGHPSTEEFIVGVHVFALLVSHAVRCPRGLRLLERAEPEDTTGILARRNQPKTRTMSHKTLERVLFRSTDRRRIHFLDRMEFLDTHAIRHSI